MNILIAGDFCPRDRVAHLFEKGDFASVLGDVKGVISEADYSIVNFECPVTKGGEKPIEKLGPNLQCSEKGMEAVKWAGFDCVTLANNHFYDFGDEGVVNTIEVCKKYGIDTVGGGINIAEASKTFYKKIGNETLAVINCCEHEFSIATDKTGGSNPLNPIQQYYAIKEAKTKAKYVLVIVHGGHEHWQLPSPRMVETYRFFIDAGADAMVNHHQHCYSGYEVYNGKPIFYGLGNFCFDKLDHRDDFWNDGYMLMLHLGDNIGFEIIPYRQCSEKPKVVLRGNEAFDSKIEELNAFITDKKRLKGETEKYYSTSATQYGNIFEPIRNRYYMALKYRGWLPSLISNKKKIQAKNYIYCEAHRDKLIWWLNHK